MEHSQNRSLSWSEFLRRPAGWRLGLFTVATIGMAAAALLTWVSIPAPQVHDEFSYLLGADTLLHGRLANPTPEHWEALQTFHVVMEPAYASKYPLGTSIFLAAGWILVGVPIAGLWLAAGLCAAAIAWMLAAVTSRTWALWAAVIFGLHPMTHLQWSHTYISAWPTVTACAIAVGAALRMRRGLNKRLAFLWGGGVAGLALCRPFEGLVFVVVLAAGQVFLWWCNAGFNARRQPWVQSFAVASVPVAAVLLLIGSQNYAVTGSVLQMPYQLHEHNYAVAPLFVFGQVLTPALEHGVIPDTVRAFHEGWSLDAFLARTGWFGWLKGIFKSLGMILMVGGIGLCLSVVLAGGLVAKFRVPAFAVLALALQVAASATVCWIYPYYLAPAAIWLVLLAVLSLRLVTRNFRKASHLLLPAAICLQLLSFGLAAYREGQAEKTPWVHARLGAIRKLNAVQGADLVLVRYGPEHDPLEEWVYNAAEPEKAEIIWARDEQQSLTQELVAHYGTRRTIWRMFPEQNFRLELVSEPPSAHESATHPVALPALRNSAGRIR